MQVMEGEGKTLSQDVEPAAGSSKNLGREQQTIAIYYSNQAVVQLQYSYKVSYIRQQATSRHVACDWAYLTLDCLVHFRAAQIGVQC